MAFESGFSTSFIICEGVILQDDKQEKKAAPDAVILSESEAASLNHSINVDRRFETHRSINAAEGYPCRWHPDTSHTG